MTTQLNDEQIHQLRSELENQFTELWSEIGSELEGSAKERFQQIAGEVRRRRLPVSTQQVIKHCTGKTVLLFF